MEKIFMIRTAIFFLLLLHHLRPISATQILSKSKLDKCEKTSDSNRLNCTRKILLDLAVPSGSSGGEASLVAEVVEVEENSTNKMQTLRIPPVITVNKSAAYALYELTYIRDVPYKPQEFYVTTRKCEPDADAKVVKICERLKDESGHVMEHTQPICCPCGPQRRIPSSCGNFFDKMLRGKANTAHCLRFPGEWFHIYGIGQRSLGFSVRIEVKAGNRVSEVVVGPENRSATSSDNFLRVNLIGDFAGYTNIPSFEDSYLVIPKQEPVTGPPQRLGTNFSMWMLLERVRFTLDGLECNKIGVSYEAFNGQPNFCSTPFWSCLHNQLWNFWDADQNRLMRHQVPQYRVEGRFERINQDPNAGTHSFSIGVTEVLNTNLLIELSADDIEYVFQRSPGKIMSITIPTFEALTQFGVAQVTIKNTGEVEASYSLRFDCTKGINLVEEQFFIMKPNEALTRSFKIYPTTDHAAKYVCSAILKDSDFAEVDRAECQFSTTATILDNGTLITGFEPPKTHNGFFEPIKRIWKKIWEAAIDFITGKSCRANCLGVFDLTCHIQYMCLSWILFVGLLLAIIPSVMVLIWLLHQKGLFDFVYDWWDDHVHDESEIENRFDANYRHGHHRDEEMRRHRHVSHRKRSSHREHGHLNGDPDYYYYLHHVHKDKFKHRHGKDSGLQNAVVEDEYGYRHRRKERSSKGQGTRHVGKKRHHHRRHSHGLDDEQGLLLQYKRRE